MEKQTWPGDNEMTTPFTAPEKFPSEFVLQLLTNNKPKDNSIFLVNAWQDTVFRKTASQLEGL